MLFFRSKGFATPLLRKNRKKKTLNLQHYPKVQYLTKAMPFWESRKLPSRIGYVSCIVLESCLQATQKFSLFCLKYYFKILKMLF
jgi:hypothetical protein